MFSLTHKTNIDLEIAGEHLKAHQKASTPASTVDVVRTLRELEEAAGNAAAELLESIPGALHIVGHRGMPIGGLAWVLRNVHVSDDYKGGQYTAYHAYKTHQTTKGDVWGGDDMTITNLGIYQYMGQTSPDGDGVFIPVNEEEAK